MGSSGLPYILITEAPFSFKEKRFQLAELLQPVVGSVQRKQIVCRAPDQNFGDLNLVPTFSRSPAIVVGTLH